jgi:hypothetical protein
MGYMILGLVIIYSTIHFFVLQKKSYSKRTDYEKVVTWVAMIGIGLLFISIMSS